MAIGFPLSNPVPAYSVLEENCEITTFMKFNWQHKNESEMEIIKIANDVIKCVGIIYDDYIFIIPLLN